MGRGEVDGDREDGKRKDLLFTTVEPVVSTLVNFFCSLFPGPVPVV